MRRESIRWALIGAGWIARTAIARAVHSAQGAELYAVASRDRRRGESLEPNGYVTTDYLRAIEDPTVDAVYIALDNAGHEEWASRALSCGKVVVCEKPLTTHAQTTERLLACARESSGFLVEAVWNLWHPRTQRAMTLVRDGAIGEVCEIAGAFTFQGVPEGNYRLDAHRGGGALLDVGCYPLTAAAWATNGSVLTLQDSRIDRGETDVDMISEVVFSTPAQRVHVRASFLEPDHQSLEVTGASGALKWLGEDAFTSYMQPSQILIRDGDSVQIEEFPPVDSYRVMIESVSARIHGDSSWLPDDVWSLRVAQAIDQALDH